MTDYSLSELTNAAGVSVRTVRYYVAEGLLPPPVSAGPKSHYTQAHLDRLQLIGQLKASYLPLREIRRYLDRLDDDEVRQLVKQAVADSAMSPASEDWPESHILADRLPPVPSPPQAQPHLQPSDSAAEYLARIMNRNRNRDSASHPITPPITHHPSSIPHDASTWRRIPLGDDAELLIREEAYRRKRDRIDWLSEWARKVLG